MKKLLMLLMTGLMGWAFAASQNPAQSLEERLKPAGNVCIQGIVCETASVSAASAEPAGPRSGEDVYAVSCAACHGTGLLASPKFGSPDDWAPRLAQGTDALYSNAINGINAMPAKGGNSALSDDEVKAAVDHMIASAQ